jgi:hypothetical protein
MQKMMRALNEAALERVAKEERGNFTPYLHKHLFNYAKGYDAAWLDPNETLMPQ